MVSLRIRELERSVSANRRHRRAALWLTSLLAASLAASAAQTDPAPSPTHFWLLANGSESTVAATLATLRESVARELAAAGLEADYPRPCTVVERSDDDGTLQLTCVESPPPGDALLLDATGAFLRFVTLDYPDARVWAFQLSLLPTTPPAIGEITEELLHHPRIAIPWFPFIESNYRALHAAVTRAILSLGAEPLDR